MMGWLQFLRGEARLRITGAVPQDCLNAFNGEGLEFWKICREDALHYCVSVRPRELSKAERLGLRTFCTVECLAGDNRHENFVSFQLKGGAADAERRERRARLIAELLEAEGFRVDVRKDALFAVAEDYDKDQILLRVRILGYLLIHTRQIDMIMLEDARVAAYRAKFEQDIAALKAK